MLKWHEGYSHHQIFSFLKKKKKKKIQHLNIPWIKPLSHISLRKPMFITWNVKRERKRDTDDWFSQYTSNKMQKKKLQKIEKTKKRQIRKGRKRKKKKDIHSLHLDSKKTTLFSWLTHQLVLAIDLMCSQIFISGSFFVLFFCLFCLLHGLLLGFFFFFLKEFAAQFFVLLIFDSLDFSRKLWNGPNGPT